MHPFISRAMRRPGNISMTRCWATRASFSTSPPTCWSTHSHRRQPAADAGQALVLLAAARLGHRHPRARPGRLLLDGRDGTPPVAHTRRAQRLASAAGRRLAAHALGHQLHDLQREFRLLGDEGEEGRLVDDGNLGRLTLASAAAARGASSIRAISPKTPPGPTCSRTLPNVMTSTAPLRTTYIALPVSCSRKIRSPASKRRGMPRRMSMPKSKSALGQCRQCLACRYGGQSYAATRLRDKPTQSSAGYARAK